MTVPVATAVSSPAPYVKTPRPRRICVIGGGAAGLAALRALVQEGGTSSNGPFKQVELIERRDKIGGVWYLNEEVVEQEKAFPGGTASHQWPVTIPTKSSPAHGNGTSASKPAWPSPAYPALRGNVLPRFLTFSGGPDFPPLSDSEDLYPSLAETQNYLEMIAKPLQPHIRCNIECLDVRELPGKREGENRWAIRIRDWNLEGGPLRTEYFDAVVLSVGWTDTPLLPRLPGLQAAMSAGLIEHSKWYRGPEVYGINSRILVVGNGNSGNDIAAQLAARRTLGEHDVVYRVARHKAWFFYVSLPDPRIKDVPAIDSLSLGADGKKVNVRLVDGSEIHDVDRVIFASGYQIGKFHNVHLLSRQPLPAEEKSLPSSDREDPDWQPKLDSNASLDTLWSSLSSPLPGSSFNMTNNPERVSQLYWQFLHARASTLAIINLTVTGIPFWCSDLQGHLVRAIWDGTLSIPDTIEDRLEYESTRIEILAAYRLQEPERLKAAQEKVAIAQKDGDAGAYIPIEHTGGPPYHILGTLVDDYAPPLRSMVLAARPEWESKLPDWNLHKAERNGMYDLKRQTLERRRKLGLDLV